MSKKHILPAISSVWKLITTPTVGEKNRHQELKLVMSLGQRQSRTNLTVLFFIVK